MIELVAAAFKQVKKFKGLLIGLYLLNLLFSILALLPLHLSIRDFAARSLAAAPGSVMAMDSVLEFSFYKKDALSAAIPLLVSVAVVYGLVQLFLLPGIVSVFIRNRKFEGQYFWGRCGKFFVRVLRLFLFSLIALILVFVLPLLFSLLKRILFGSDPYESVNFWFGWLRTITQMTLLPIYFLILDYAVILVLKNDQAKMWSALLQSLRFNWDYFSQTAGLTFFIAAMSIGLLLIYYALASLLSGSQVFLALLLFLVQQVYIFSSVGLRLLRYASQVQLFHQTQE